MALKKSFIYQGLAVAMAGLIITAVVAFAWTEPSTTPPGGNVSAPVNIGDIGQSKSGGLILNTGGAANGLIVDKGNVGIGTTNPGRLLDVAGVIRGQATALSGDVIELGNDTKLRDINIANTVGLWGLQDNTVSALRFGSTANTVITSIANANSYFNNGGNVGIGTTGPQSIVHIRKDVANGVGAFLYLQNSQYANAEGASTGIRFNIYGENIRYGDIKAVGKSIYGQLDRIALGITNDSDVYVEAISIKNNGYVGIGITNPGAKLEVAGQVKITGGSPGNGKVLTSDASGLAAWTTPSSGLGGSGSTNYISKWTGASSLGNSIIYDNGNVGIGTTGPGARLHVDSGATANVARFYSSNNAPEIFVGQASAANQATALGYNVSGGYTFLQTYGDPWGTFVIKNGGNVGIGTTGPVSKLDVRGNISLDRSRYIYFGLEGVTGEYINENPVGTVNFYSGSQLKIKLPNDGTSMALMPNGGNVGIGTTGPTAPLDVNGQIRIRGGAPGVNKVLTSDANGLATWTTPSSGLGGSGSTNYITKWTSASSLGNSTIYDNGTNVGIGTTGPGEKLDVNGNIKLMTTGTATLGTQYPSYQILFDSSSWSTYYGSSVNRQWKIKSIGQNNYWGQPRLSFLSDYDNIERMVIDMNTGNVGIGTTGPNAKLAVGGTGSAGDAVAAYTNSAGSAVYAQQSGAGYAGYFSGKAYVSTNLSVGGLTSCSNVKTNSSGLLQCNSAAYLTAETDPQVNTLTANKWCTASADGSAVNCTSDTPAGGVTSVSNSNGTLTISPTTGAVVASLNLAKANIWTAAQTFNANTNFPGSGIWNSSGNVGIGTTGPGEKLQVNGNVLVNAGRVTAGNGSGNGNTSGIWFWNNTDSNHVIYSANSATGIRPGGSVAGDAPDNKLGAAGEHRLRFRTSTGQGWLFENNSNVGVIDFDADDGSAYFGGNVGIGTTAPDFRLQIKSNVYQSGGGTEDRTIAIQTVANVPVPVLGQTYYPANNSPGINFLNSNGSFLGALGLSGWSGAWGGLAQPRDISLGAYDGYLVLRAGHNPGIDSLIGRVFISPTNGHVGVGIRDAGTYRMYVNGPLAVNGTADKAGGGSWGTLSDSRLKDVTGVFNNGLDKIAELQPIRYQYKQDNPMGVDSKNEYIGFVAQDVQKVIPEAVRMNDQGYLLIDNDPILWTMLNSIKELKAENENLKQRLNTIEELLKIRN